MSIIERIRREIARLFRRLEPSQNREEHTDAAIAPEAPATHAEAREEPPQTPSAPEPEPEPAVPQERVDWRWGGVDASSAEVDAAVKVGSVRISDDRISYRWDAAPRDWKRAQTEKGALVLACAFVWDDARGAWVGGKFDWTDESRNSRSTENILKGYNGWDAAAWKRAKVRGFCVASADGKKRSAIVKG